MRSVRTKTILFGALFLAGGLLGVLLIASLGSAPDAVPDLAPQATRSDSPGPAGSIDPTVFAAARAPALPGLVLASGPAPLALSATVPQAGWSAPGVPYAPTELPPGLAPDLDPPLVGPSAFRRAPNSSLGSASLLEPPPPPAKPTPRPSFCPLSSREKIEKSASGRERFCTRPDKGGIQFRHGPYLAWHSNGRKSLEGAYVDGRASGAWVEYFANGKKSGKGAYQAGRKKGAWTFYWESGRTSSKGTFRNGDKHGRWTYFDERGRKESSGELRTANKVEHEIGVWTYWHPNGRKKTEGTFKGGRREGRWTEWDDRGQVVAVDRYRDGERESL